MEAPNHIYEGVRSALNRAALADSVFSACLERDKNPLIITDVSDAPSNEFFAPSTWKDGHVHNLVRSWPAVHHHVLVGFQVQNSWELERSFCIQVAEVRIDWISIISDQSERPSISHLMHHKTDDPVLFELARLRSSGRTQWQYGIDLTSILERFPRSMERIAEQITLVGQVICAQPGTFQEV